jgi:hypothetical protein
MILAFFRLFFDSILQGENIMENIEYSWRSVFVAALSGITCEESLAALSVAEDAVFERLFELEGTNGTEDERRSLEDTMQDILLVRGRSHYFRAGN